MTHVITTTMEPNRPYEVSDTEFLDLTRMGVVSSELPSDLTQVPAPTPLVSAQTTAAMQAGGAQKETDGGQQQEADGSGPAQAAVE